MLIPLLRQERGAALEALSPWLQGTAEEHGKHWLKQHARQGCSYLHDGRGQREADEPLTTFLNTHSLPWDGLNEKCKGKLVPELRPRRGAQPLAAAEVGTNPPAPWPLQLVWGPQCQRDMGSPHAVQSRAAASLWGSAGVWGSASQQHPRQQHRCHGTVQHWGIYQHCSIMSLTPALLGPPLCAVVMLPPRLVLLSQAVADAVPATKTKRPEFSFRSSDSPVLLGWIPH